MYHQELEGNGDGPDPTGKKKKKTKHLVVIPDESAVNVTTGPG